MDTALNIVHITPSRFSGGLSPVLDGGGKGASWHRLRLGGDMSAVSVSLYSSDEKRFICGGASADIDRLAQMPPERREQVLRQCHVKTLTGCADILLSDVRGRYFWFGVTRADESETAAEVSFPLQSPLRYLPEVYQTGRKPDFTEHYLSIFQSIYDDLEEQIDRSSTYMDAERCPAPFVKWLAGWLGLSDISLWPDEALREYVREAPALGALRGTAQGLTRLLKLYCPGEYFVVEGRRVSRWAASPQWPVLSRIYPTGGFSFAVLAFGPFAAQREDALRQLLERHKPAHTTASLRVLAARAVLDCDGYLGINTVLSGVGAARLNALSALNAIMLGG